MSIASNIIDENTKLGNARTILREKLTAWNIDYNHSDTLFELLKRWRYTDNQLSILIFYPSVNECIARAEVTAGAVIKDEDNQPIEDMPVKVTCGGQTYNILTDTNGRAEVTLTVGEAGSTFSGTVTAGNQSESWTYENIKLFGMEEDNPDDSMFDIIKYPVDIELTLEPYEYDTGYNDSGLLVSKQTNNASAVFLIPKGTPAITDSGIHFKCGMVQKKTSNQGWGDAICLLNSKELSHARDTKILELGAYAAKKGVRYSTSDHVIRDISVTTGQLALDSKWYTFEFYYDDGYLEATIKDGSNTVFSYTGDVSESITLDSYYPAFMIYDAGGSMIFNNILIEPWTHEGE
ncbi:MAG: Ig-like domain-containing protein [Methanobrevibacter sp.]|uniref:Ig-like domain-containing protein n=1 Tax=Methanobrevibacter sp. TaxID=66852 RepID=UPI002E75C98A|nr:Ig-like domain-containing protein [Methanobrevibacter sp.]MEE0936078.1 Ig-like domain-containing protein [Methanobrevibacter sp.]